MKRGIVLALPSLRAQRSNPFFLCAARWIASASLAMTACGGKKAARAALGDRWKPRALWKEEVGSLLLSADVNAVTSDAELNTNRIRLNVSRITPAIIFSSASVAVFGSVTVLGACVTMGCARFSAAI